MPRARALAVVVLLLSYGAVGGRQPAVRSSVPLSVPAASIAESLHLPVADRSHIVLDIIRVLFDTPDGLDPKDAQLRARLNGLLASNQRGETVPLPLDPSVWRETILRRDVPDTGLVTAILSERRTALLYHGLAALDDETLGWLGAERDVITYLLEHAGAFATAAGSFKVRAGRVVVPGGSDAEAIWERVLGASPSKPVAFTRRLFGSSSGRLAFFYDSVANLDEANQRFALALNLPANSRSDRVRALAEVFVQSFAELEVEQRPFARHPVDPSITLAYVRVRPDGTLIGPSSRWLWESVFQLDEGSEPGFAEFERERVPKRMDDTRVDAAWVASRIHNRASINARRRLDTFLFAQRVFGEREPDPTAEMVTALRGMMAFPTLMLTLERCGVRSPAVLAAAALRADALNAMGDAYRKSAVRLFQASLGIIDRATVWGGLTTESTGARISSLLALDLTKEESLPQFKNWLRNDLLPSMASREDSQTAEQTILAALAGANTAGRATVLEWEGRRYHVSPQLGELRRLRHVRERQGGASLDDVLSEPAASPGAASKGRDSNRLDAEALADVLTSILYAAHLGEPDGRILSAGNVALRHDPTVDTGGAPRPLSSWRFAVEAFGQEAGWQMRGSLLGLDVALARFALRRLDLTTMPPAPRLTSNERHTGALTVALMRAQDLNDETRNELAAAVKRGRARFAALTASRGDIDRFAGDIGMSGWRRESLAWALQHDREHLDSHVTFVDLMLVGVPRTTGRVLLDAWGAAVLPVTGCLCLEMPRATAWESLAGRPSVGLLATRGADVALLVAEELTALELPASLASGVLAFAMQDVIDAAQPGYFDDWTEFGRATQSLPRERILDYVAALTAGGPLLPMETNNGKRP